MELPEIKDLDLSFINKILPFEFSFLFQLSDAAISTDHHSMDIGLFVDAEVSGDIKHDSISSLKTVSAGGDHDHPTTPNGLR